MALECTEPLNPADLGVWVGGLVGKAVDFILFFVALAVVVLLGDRSYLGLGLRVQFAVEHFHLY